MCSIIGGLVLSGASLAAGTVQNIEARKASNKAIRNQRGMYRRNAEIASQRAAIARKKGARNAEQARRKFLSATGQNQNSMAAGNVVLGSGSALDLMVNNRAIAGQQIADAKYEGELNAWEHENSRDDMLMRARAQRTTSTSPLFLVQTARKANTWGLDIKNWHDSL